MEKSHFPTASSHPNRYEGEVTKKFVKLPCYLVVDQNNHQSFIWSKKKLADLLNEGKYKVVKKVKYKAQFQNKWK